MKYRLTRLLRSRQLWKFITWLLILITLSTSQPLRLTYSQGNADSVESRFGAVESFYRPEDAAKLGIGWERIIFEWRFFQPDNADQWDTSQVPDAWLQAAAQSGREVIGLIKNAPHWATGSPLLGAPPLGLDQPIDDPTNYFGAFMTRLVTYYSQKWNIHHWIIYNEPDIQATDTPYFEFAGTAIDYYHVLKVAYLAAHRADPHAVIHFAGTTWWQDTAHNRPQFIARVLQAASQDPDAAAHGLFFDVLSIHVYDRTELVWQMVNELGALPAAAGFPKAIWIDEMNAHPTQDVDWRINHPYYTVTLKQQADFLMQAAALGLAAGAERVGVYRLYDNVGDQQNGDGNAAWGLIRNDGSHRPGYDAWHTVIEEFSRTISAGRIDHDPKSSVAVVTLRQPDRTLIVVWNRTGVPIPLSIENQPGLAAYSVSDDPIPLIQNNGFAQVTLPPCIAPCLIEGSPILITLSNPATEPESVLATINKQGDRLPINAASQAARPRPKQPLTSPEGAATPADGH